MELRLAELVVDQLISMQFRLMAAHPTTNVRILDDLTDAAMAHLMTLEDEDENRRLVNDP